MTRRGCYYLELGMIKTSRSILAAVMAIGGLVSAGAAPSTQPATTRPSESAATTRPYPMDVCVVSGEKLNSMGDAPVILQWQGREVRFCCRDCVEEFKRDPARYLAKLDAAAKAKEEK